jgi:hypothetical protein
MVRRCVEAARACGLDRAGGEGQLGVELPSAVAERVRLDRADGHGGSWAVLAAHHARLKELLDAGLTVVRAGNCSPATVWSCRGGRCTSVRWRCWAAAGEPKPAVRVANCEPGADCPVGRMGLLDRYWSQQCWHGRVVVGCERDTPTDYERPGPAVAPRSPGVGLSRV